MSTESLTKDELLSYIENEAKIRIDSLVEGSIETAEEVHAGIKREDDTSSFLESHIWPVTLDVIRHYQSTHKLLTTLQISSAILHDVMEDNDRILDLYASKPYAFDAYRSKILSLSSITSCKIADEICRVVSSLCVDW